MIAGCFKCISGINLSPAKDDLRGPNKGKTRENLTKEFDLKVFLFDFLPLHTAHFDKKHYFSIFSFYNFWIFTFCVFSILQTIR